MLAFLRRVRIENEDKLEGRANVVAVDDVTLFSILLAEFKSDDGFVLLQQVNKLVLGESTLYITTNFYVNHINIKYLNYFERKMKYVIDNEWERGSKNELIVGLASCAITQVIATTFGLILAYWGGKNIQIKRK